MKKLFFLILAFTAIPFQAFCQSMTVSELYLNDQIYQIENAGYTVISARCQNPNSHITQRIWVITYQQQQRLDGQRRGW